MSFLPSSPLTGATVTGLTSPTYTLVQDSQPTPESKQYYVSALGGTQTGVTVHSVSSPFTLAYFRPKVLEVLDFFSSLTGFKRKVPRNHHRIVVRKGCTPIAGAPVEICMISIDLNIAAGVDVNDLPNLRALVSAAFGLAWNQASGAVDTITTGSV